MADELDALLAEVDIRAPGNTGNWSGDFQLEISDPELARRLAAAVRDLQADRDVAIRALGRSLEGDWPIGSADGGPSHWRYDDAEVTPAEVAAIAQATREWGTDG